MTRKRKWLSLGGSCCLTALAYVCSKRQSGVLHACLCRARCLPHALVAWAWVADMRRGVGRRCGVCGGGTVATCSSLLPCFRSWAWQDAQRMRHMATAVSWARHIAVGGLAYLRGKTRLGACLPADTMCIRAIRSILPGGMAACVEVSKWRRVYGCAWRRCKRHIRDAERAAALPADGGHRLAPASRQLRAPHCGSALPDLLVAPLLRGGISHARATHWAAAARMRTQHCSCCLRRCGWLLKRPGRFLVYRAMGDSLRAFIVVSAGVRFRAILAAAPSGDMKKEREDAGCAFAWRA